MKSYGILLLIILALLFTAQTAMADTTTYLDFDDGTTMGWTDAASSLLYPTSTPNSLKIDTLSADAALSPVIITGTKSVHFNVTVTGAITSNANFWQVRNHNVTASGGVLIANYPTVGQWGYQSSCTGAWTASGVAYTDTASHAILINYTVGTNAIHVSVNGTTIWTGTCNAGTNFNRIESYKAGSAIAYIDDFTVCSNFACNVTGPPPVNLVTVNLTNSVTGSSWPETVSFSNVTGALAFSYFNITATGFCATYTGNGTGTNCTSASSGEFATYFNTSKAASITGTQGVIANTSGVLLSITAEQLFTNNSIQTFNVTNGLSFNTTTGGTLYVAGNRGNQSVRIDVPGNYSMNATCSVPTSCAGTCHPATIACEITGVYDNQFTIGAKFSSASITTFASQASNTILGGILYNMSTTNGSLVFPLLQGYEYTFGLQAPNYAHTNATLPANASTNLYNFSLLISNVFNIVFYDEQTDQTIITANITLDVIPSVGTGSSYHTTNGTLQTTILSPDDYTLRYYGINNTGGANYSTRFWYLTLLNNTMIDLRLPLLREASSTLVTTTTVSSTSIPLPGLIVKAYKYDTFTGTYVLNQMVVTNTEGQAVFSLQLASEFYYFTVENDEEVLLISEPAYIYANTIEPFVIDLLIGGFGEFFGANNLLGSITLNNNTGLATFTYIDSDNTATQGCLYAYQFTTAGKILQDSSCEASSSGTVQVSFNTTGNWQFQGLVTKDTVDNLVASASLNYASPPTGERDNRMGLFVLLMVTIVFIFVLRKHPAIMVAIIGLLPLLFSIINFIAIGVPYTIGVALLGFGLALLLGRSQPSI